MYVTDLSVHHVCYDILCCEGALVSISAVIQPTNPCLSRATLCLLPSQCRTEVPVQSRDNLWMTGEARVG